MTTRITSELHRETESFVGGLRLALVTPARNEAAFIEGTLKSMVAQCMKPVRWVIVSDGSTDGTDELVMKYVQQRSWIELVRLPERRDRHFAGKVFAFNAGYERLKEVPYDVIGNVDADITFDPEHLAFLLRKFTEDPQLGVAGSPFVEGDLRYDYRFTSLTHVSGCCQLFRRECFEEIGGYVPIQIGGIDLVAVLTARMKGWRTRTFPEKVCVHHRKIGTAKQNRLMVAFRGGKGDYRLGMHPLWELSRTPYQMTKRPYIVAGGLRLAGFTWAMMTRAPKLISVEIVNFRRAEQMSRLRQFVGRFFQPSAERQGGVPTPGTRTL